MKGLFKRLSLLTASLAMVFGVGLVNNEKRAKAEGSTYAKVTSNLDDWSGEYILVYENSTTEAYVWTGVDAGKCYEAASIADSKIIMSPTAKLNIEAMNDGYSVKVVGGTNNGKYMYGQNNKNTILFSATASSSTLNTFEFESSEIKITSNSTYMRFNSANGNNNLRFRYYKSISQQPVQLYKLEETQDKPKIDLNLSSSLMKINGKLNLTAKTSGEASEIIWESSDTNIASVNNGTITANKVGMATITATYGTATAECKVYINEHSGTSADDPLTIAEAIKTIDLGSSNDAFVKGIVVSKVFQSSFYSEVWVSDDGTETNLFEFYNFYAGEKETEFSEDIINQGDTLIGYGTLTKYEKYDKTIIYELNKGCYLVQRIEKEIDIIEATLKNTKDFYVNDVLNESDIEVYVLYADATGETIENGYTVEPALPYTFTSEDATNGSVEFTVSYRNISDSFSVNVKETPNDLVLMEIKISEGENVKKTYYVGDTYDVTGLTVTATLTSDSTMEDYYEDVTDKVKWSLDTSKANDSAQLTASYTYDDVTEEDYITVQVLAAPTYMVDKITADDLIEEATTSYTDFFNRTASNDNNSSVKYAGQCAKTSNAGGNIQMRSKNNNSGIVSTSAKGILSKIEINWASNTTKGRVINVYVSNTPFSTAADLYNTSLEPIKQITYDGTNTTSTLDILNDAEITSKYAYVGIRSNNSALYLTSVSFTWERSSNAEGFIEMWNEMRANGTNGICDYLNGSQTPNELDELLDTYYNDETLTDADKAIINDAADGENNTIGNSITFIEAYKASHTSNGANANNGVAKISKNNIAFILIIGFLGLSSVVGYYLIQKRRLSK